jgi:hypothetical protein
MLCPSWQPWPTSSPGRAVASGTPLARTRLGTAMPEARDRPGVGWPLIPSPDSTALTFSSCGAVLGRGEEGSQMPPDPTGSSLPSLSSFPPSFPSFFPPSFLPPFLLSLPSFPLPSSFLPPSFLTREDGEALLSPPSDFLLSKSQQMAWVLSVVLG